MAVLAGSVARLAGLFGLWATRNAVAVYPHFGSTHRRALQNHMTDILDRSASE